MTSKRSDKIAETIHEVISALLIKGVKDPRIGFTTITGVKVADDLHLATVFFSVIGTDEEKKATTDGLNSARGFMRKELAKALRMRYVPEVVFKYDSSLEYGHHIDTLLNEISADRDNDTEDP
jgi:ribosome-binding factor A